MEKLESNFILQRLGSMNHAAAINENLNKKIISGIISVAFLRFSGVKILKDLIKSSGSKIDYYVGIRNGITSYQGVAALCELVGNGIYVVDTGANDIIFHPKIYCFELDDSYNFIVGSANLTHGGLISNIEASAKFNLAKSNEAVDGLKAIIDSFDLLKTENPENVYKVTSKSEIDRLLEMGLIVDESALPLSSIAAKEPIDFVSVKKIKLKDYHSAGNMDVDIPLIPERLRVSSEYSYVEVWRSALLERRDLNIPIGDKSNRTGSINLDKGNLPNNIDFRHYFRDVVFKDLEWSPRSLNVDEAQIVVFLSVMGFSKGYFATQVRHSNSLVSRSYEQGNAMTRLSWGSMREHVADINLIHRNLTLFKCVGKNDQFLISID